MFSKSKIIELIMNKDLSQSGIQKILTTNDLEVKELIEVLIVSLKSGYLELGLSILTELKEEIINYPIEYQTIKKIVFGKGEFMEILELIEKNLKFDTINIDENQKENFCEFLDKVDLNLRNGYKLALSKGFDRFVQELKFLDSLDIENTHKLIGFLKKYLQIHTQNFERTKNHILKKISSEGGNIKNVMNMSKPKIKLRERIDASMEIENATEVFLYEHKIEINQIDNITSSPYFLYANKNEEDFFIGKHYYKDAIISYTSEMASYIRYSHNGGFKYADLNINNNQYEQIYIRSQADQKNYIELDKPVSKSQMESIQKKVSGLAEISNLLSGNQDLLFRSPIDGVVLIEGVSGSGKTNLIFHRIDYLLQEFPKKFRKDKIAIFVKNGYLKSYMKNTLKSTQFTFKDFIDINLMDEFLTNALFKYSNLPDRPVLNKHSKNLQRTNQINDLTDKFLKIYQTELKTFEINGKYNIDKILGKWYEMIGENFKDTYLCQEELILIAYLINQINQKLYDYSLFSYDYVLVDEFQDFTFPQLSFLVKTFGKSLVLSGDFTQSVIHGREILENLGAHVWKGKAMTDNFRNTYEIVKFATNIFDDNEKKDLLLAKRVIRTGMEPILFENENTDKIANQLEDLIQQSLKENKKLAVIYHDLKYTKQIYEKLNTKISGMFPQIEKTDLEDFYNAKIYFLSYWESKGLEFDKVVLIDPENLLKEKTVGNKKLFYIGATRAVFELYLFTGKNRDF